MQSEDYVDFRQYLFAIRRRWLPAAAVFGSVALLTALSTLLQKPVYEARGSILIKRPNSVTSAVTQEKSGQETPQAVGRESDPLNTEAELIRSTTIARKIITAFNLELKPENFRKNLSVQSLKGTDILSLSYQSTDPQQAAAVVNQVMNLYLKDDVSINRTEAAAVRQFISEQLPITKANLYRSEANLREFEEENNVVNLEEEAKSAVEVIARLENQVSEARAKLADANSQSKELQEKLGMDSQQAIAANSLGQSPGVQSALKELQQVESDLATGRTRFHETHPTIANLKSKKASLEVLLEGRVKQVVGDQKLQPSTAFQNEDIKQQITANLVQLEAERLGLASQVSALSRVLDTSIKRTDALPKLKQRQRELEREVEAAQSTYTTLVKRLEEIRVEENRNLGNARIVENAAVPAVPVAPDKARNLVLGSLLGLLLGVGTALLLDGLDTSIKSVKEAREVFGYTLLGLIPLVGKPEKVMGRDRNSEQSVPKIVVQDTSHSQISEAYRILKANLGFLCSDKELKVVVVTSSTPQEGKSTVAANLAVAMAQSGRRVLLVDADMRQPMQHKIWELLNQAGLSNVLVGQAELRTVIREVMVNLSVLTAGVTPPNPMNLLESQRMAALIENFSDQYDFVIIDTPSVSIAADAPILGKMSDGILLVVRPGVVDAASAASAKEFLQQSSQNVLGLVVNGVTSDNKPYSSYHAKEYYVEENSTTREAVASESRRNTSRS